MSNHTSSVTAIEASSSGNPVSFKENLCRDVLQTVWWLNASKCTVNLSHYEFTRNRVTNILRRYNNNLVLIKNVKLLCCLTLQWMMTEQSEHTLNKQEVNVEKYT
jgi:hypothetical protein